MPGGPPISWLQEIRPHQVRAVDRIVAAFHGGARAVFLDAPTGSGKTLIGELVRRQLGTRAVYICSDRRLQRQVLRDFPEARLLEGRANYKTERFPKRFPTINAGLCNATATSACSLCKPMDACPYRRAKEAALSAELAVVNTSYFLAEANFVGGLSETPFVIADEADRLDAALIGFAEASFSNYVLRQLRHPAPQHDGTDTMLDWLAELQDKADAAYKYLDLDSADPEVVRWARALMTTTAKARDAYDGLERGTWIAIVGGADPVTVKPITPSEIGADLLWSHGRRWLLMSATILDARQLAADLGCRYPTQEVVPVEVESTFPPQNRPVYIRPVADMAYKNRDVAWPAMAAEVARLVASYPGERILVHTQSYTLTRYLADHLATVPALATRTILEHRQNSIRGATEDVLQRYRTTEGAVLLSPTVTRGVDLPDELCRVQVVVKLPWASKGDPQVAARSKGLQGSHWYTTDMVRSLVQATGRGVRHERDTCVTFILDGGFHRIWYWSWRLLPAYWRLAVRLPKAPLHLNPFPPLASPYAALGRSA